MTENAPERSAKPAYAIAIIGGALLWLAATLISGKREAWDSSLYWTVEDEWRMADGGWQKRSAGQTPASYKLQVASYKGPRPQACSLRLAA